jgi:hypothetical protein
VTRLEGDTNFDASFVTAERDGYGEVPLNRRIL